MTITTDTLGGEAATPPPTGTTRLPWNDRAVIAGLMAEVERYRDTERLEAARLAERYNALCNALRRIHRPNVRSEELVDEVLSALSPFKALLADTQRSLAMVTKGSVELEAQHRAHVEEHEEGTKLERLPEGTDAPEAAAMDALASQLLRALLAAAVSKARAEERERLLGTTGPMECPQCAAGLCVEVRDPDTALHLAYDSPLFAAVAEWQAAREAEASYIGREDSPRHQELMERYRLAGLALAVIPLPKGDV